MKKITELAGIETLSMSDIIPIVDVDENATKQVTVETLFGILNTIKGSTQIINDLNNAEVGSVYLFSNTTSNKPAVGESYGAVITIGNAYDVGCGVFKFQLAFTTDGYILTRRSINNGGYTIWKSIQIN